MADKAPRNTTPTSGYQLQHTPSGEVEALYPPWSHFYGDDDDEEHPEYYMSPEAQEKLATDSSLTENDIMVIQHLAMRKFHVPGNTYWEDYINWFCNNHPFICFCYADPRHPLGRHERIMNLVASLAFGLAATCSVVLWFFYEHEDFHRVIVTAFGFDISIGMIVLFIFGGPLHVLFDLGIYFVQACPPCRPGGLAGKVGLPEPQQKCWLWLGAHVAFLVTIASLSLAINVMLIRASINEDGDDEDIARDLNAYSFLGLYILEVLVANFVIFPIGTFTMFSGVLGCGVIPGIGGRPFQVKKWERKQARKQRRKAKEQGEELV